MPYPGKLRSRSTRNRTNSAARAKPQIMNTPHPAPVSGISSTGREVAWGVTDGVPGPGVRVGSRVIVGDGVLVAVPGTGVFVRVAGGLVAAGTFVGGIGDTITAGVTGRNVGVGAAVGVWVGVSVGVGVKVDVGAVVAVGGVVGEGVLVGVGVSVGSP